MEIFCKKNNELTYHELEVLFQLYVYNNSQIRSNSIKIKNINTEEYKQNWIKSALENNSLFCVECVESNNLIGFAFVTLMKNENYINEMHIIEGRRQDGVTFRAMVNAILQNSQVGKDFTGIIWQENYDAKKIFKSMGALLIDGKYRLSYDKVQTWLNKAPNEKNDTYV